MKHKNNIAIDNSFTLNIQNLGGLETDVSLFELGVFGNNVPIDSQFNQGEGDINSEFAVVSGTPSGIAKTSDDIEISPATLNFRFTNEKTQVSNLNISGGTTLTDVNILLNGLGVFPVDTTSDVIIGFKPLSVAGVPTEWFANFKYANPLGTNSPITSVLFSGNLNTTFSVPSPTQKAIATNSSTSMVKVIDSANLTYDEILRSQSGSVLDVRSMAYNLLFAEEPTDQMNQCMRFRKIDVNGQSVVYFKCPVKDPYQFQNSFGVIDMGQKADVYTLDGQTGFDYTLKPFSNLNITFNYAELTNLMLLPEEVAQARKQRKDLAEYSKDDDYKREYKLEIPYASADGVDNKDKPKVKKSSNVKKKIVL